MKYFYNFSYSKLIGRFNYDAISKFIGKQYKGQSSNISKNCEEIFLKRKEANQQSRLSDLDEEIRNFGIGKIKKERNGKRIKKRKEKKIKNPEIIYDFNQKIILINNLYKLKMISFFLFIFKLFEFLIQPNIKF
ncbi:unnamed protein product [Paramecium pentaurelia]|uniref:Uncharacterized protein n=1 Tax=Paramecium pentaurelia TaxID=43138 RepID=A0A8S1X3W3_9CILI|nr:unnamed protein product [Paramecium pentaurelia]